MPAAKALTYRVDPFDLRLFTAVLEHGTITACRWPQPVRA